MKSPALWSGLVAVCALAVLFDARGASDPAQDALFLRALDNQSTAPSFVLITVVDDRAGTSQMVCTEAPFLLGAIHFEKRRSYDEENVAKVVESARNQKDRIFHFSRKDALKKVARIYTDKQLAEMRAALGPLSNKEILKGFSRPGGLHSLYQDKKPDEYSAYRSAIAHVLIENGLLPGEGMCGRLPDRGKMKLPDRTRR